MKTTQATHRNTVSTNHTQEPATPTGIEDHRRSDACRESLEHSDSTLNSNDEPNGQREHQTIQEQAAANPIIESEDTTPHSETHASILLTATPASTLALVDYPPQRWPIQDLLPEGLTIFAGAPKSGKSKLLLAWSWIIAAGIETEDELEFGHGDVLFLALEDSDSSIKRQLQMLSRTLGEIPNRLLLSTDLPTEDRSKIPASVGNWMIRHPNTKLIIIDTLARVRPASGVGSTLYERDTNALIPWQNIAKRFRVSIVLVHHAKKQKSANTFDSISGSLGLNGVADAMMIMERIKGEPTALLHATGREVRDQTLNFERNQDGCWVCRGEDPIIASTQERTEILLVLQHSTIAMSAPEIAAQLGKERSNIVHRLTGLCDEGLVIKPRRGLYQAVTPVTESQETPQIEDRTGVGDDVTAVTE